MNRSLRTLAFPVVLTIILSMSAVVVVCGQGGTGRVTPTPTPTPKKTTPKKPTPAKTTSDSKTSQPAKSATNDSNAAEMIFWNSIKDSKNAEDFRSYLKKYPKGEFTDLARNRLSSLEDKASWEKIKDSSNPEDFKEYLKKFRQGEFADLARNRLSRLEDKASWEKIKGSPSPDDFKDYLKKYPKGEFTDLARSHLNSLEGAARWEKIKDSTNSEDFKEYLRQYPDGQFVRLAADRLKILERLPRTRTNQAGISFVLISPGSFMMGGAGEQPIHQVTINYWFYIGKYEVTQAQWQSVMGKNPSYFNHRANWPVEQVSWNDAQNFVDKLNESNDGFRYRLPTEAEWEYACRAGTTGEYAGNLRDMAWYFETSGDSPSDVGGKQPNAWGLFDMHGNVWEWCQDWYQSRYSGAPTDGSAWLSGGEQKYRVLRGGSFYDRASWLRSAFRHFDTPDSRSQYFGFRVVAVPRTQ